MSVSTAQSGGLLHGRDAAFRRAERHSYVVRVLRLLIPFGSIALVFGFVGLFGLARLTPQEDGIDTRMAGVTGGKVTMQAPQLSGFQKDQRSYRVTADTALQAIKSPEMVELATPIARVETEKNMFADINAANGLYNTKDETLRLEKNIKIVTDSGYKLQMNAADIQLKDGALKTKDRVVIDMSNGQINRSEERRVGKEC